MQRSNLEGKDELRELMAERKDDVREFKLFEVSPVTDCSRQLSTRGNYRVP